MPLSSESLTDNSVVCLMAPTASGKTALAYELYDSGRYELVSVDSALIYRDMNIGTAKPTATELERYPHHLVDIIDPTQSYSVAEFVTDVAKLIDRCHQNGKIPLLVGGTMMYYMALLDGLSPVPDSNDEVRQQVEEWRLTEGISTLYDYLGNVDPISHQRLKPADTQRITRAVEVYLQTDMPLSEWQRQPKQALAHNPAQRWHALAVMPDRPWLHERIAQRLDIMWNEGLVAEVMDLLMRYPLTPNMPAMRCVGYRQVLEYLVHTQHPIFEAPHLDKAQFYAVFSQPNETSSCQTSQNNTSRKTASTFKPNNETNTEHQALACHQMQNKALYATRQLAKRQYTWLRKLTQLSNDDSDTSISSESSSHTNNNMMIQSFITMAQAGDYLRI
ncbi:tRNA (adenosine(37)-N6)-dimethylallyltransferase MiaA [Psychrobacter urativorans]|uniref:tRNA (adenosine(37)-N6)-dimethylallyltransferase MiaA n=1 Tax=Psychrobacter urativorans TaxID=45610 RepID=UPI001919836F|nr:tRNA (adenosine(37)-N6)-dimethylallyltransferase MiaA [Psychrobacter urativorans]